MPNILRCELVKGQAMRLQTAFTALDSLTDQAQKVEATASGVRTAAERTKQQRKHISQKPTARLELMLQQEQTGERERWRGKENGYHCVLHCTVQITSLSSEHLLH